VQIADRRNKDEELVFKTGPGTCAYDKFTMNNMPRKNLNFTVYIFTDKHTKKTGK